ncbi:MAG: hypothetical protein O7D91_19870 [Planctomycetota bacterium]|nr:hypothetical protein [Planctomycetota bacterium]
MAKKAGRPANHWTDTLTGEVINGLGRRPCKPGKPGRFYAIGHHKTFGTDEQLAIRRYHAWKQGKTTSPPAMVLASSQKIAAGERNLLTFWHEHQEYEVVPSHLKALIKDHPAFNRQFPAFLLETGLHRDIGPSDQAPERCDCQHCTWFSTGGDPDDRTPAQREIHDRLMRYIEEGYAPNWASYLEWIIGRWIESKPKEAANRLGVPALANLEAIKPRPLSVPLAKIADLYESRSSGRKSYNAESARFFRRFAKIVGVRTVREIESDHVVKYEKRILDEFYKMDRGDDWLSKRFGGIRRVVRYARKRGLDRDEITRVLGLCEMLEIPKSTEAAERMPEPNPITRDHLHAILGLADTRQTAIILLSLNCLYLPIDNARIPEEVIDFEAGTVYFPRVKPRTKIPRVAVLWDRTLRALRAYKDEYPHDARDAKGRKVLIVTQQLKPLTENSHTWFCKWWRSLRDRAGLPADVTFKTLRSGGYTEACQVSRDQADVLAGHHLPGKTDHYLKRNPRFVAPACAAIESHYFD